MEFEKNGCRMHYAQVGEGRDIVLLHGWGGCIDSWKPLMRDLQAHARVSALDFPGHGQSAEPPAPWDVSDFAQATAEWMRAAGIEKADVVAHSFGGRVGSCWRQSIRNWSASSCSRVFRCRDCWKTGRTRKSDCAVLFIVLCAVCALRGCWALRARRGCAKRWCSASVRRITGCYPRPCGKRSIA